MTTTGLAYQINMSVVDECELFAIGETCQHCLEHDTTCGVWAIQESTSATRHEITRTCCTGCLVAVIDSIDYLDITSSITVEVTRNATLRPF